MRVKLETACGCVKYMAIPDRVPPPEVRVPLIHFRPKFFPSGADPDITTGIRVFGFTGRMDEDTGAEIYRETE